MQEDEPSFSCLMVIDDRGNSREVGVTYYVYHPGFVCSPPSICLSILLHSAVDFLIILYTSDTLGSHSICEADQKTTQNYLQIGHRSIAFLQGCNYLCVPSKICLQHSPNDTTPSIGSVSKRPLWSRVWAMDSPVVLPKPTTPGTWSSSPEAVVREVNILSNPPFPTPTIISQLLGPM